MEKKVIQFKARCGWNRASVDDIESFIRRLSPLRFTGRLRDAIRYLTGNGRDLGIIFRFDKLKKCREISYKSYSQTEECLRYMEKEGMCQ